MRLSVPFFSLVLAVAGIAGAQVNFKDAFPGQVFKRPVYFGELPGVATQTFVILEQHIGHVTLLAKKDGKWDTTALYTVAVNPANEQGLLGIAFHPDFKNNHKYYISWDPPGTMYNIVEERETDATLMKDAGKSRILIKQSDKYDNHNGGTIAFGPKDGYLYIGLGDGGNQYDPDGNGQNKNVLLAKMLRIDVNKKDAGLEYGIPSDNPFAGQANTRGEIWAYGFRNPWKWSFDPVTGDQYVGDVGQDAVEEVDIVTKGGNYGWDPMEGPNGDNNGSMILPINSWGHNGGNNCVIGGVVYRGNPASKYYGTYFFSDNNGKALWNLKKNGTAVVPSTKVGTFPDKPTTFGTDSQGLVYAAIYSEASPIYLLDSPDLGPAPTALAPRYHVSYRPEWKGLRFRMDGREYPAARVRP